MRSFAESIGIREAAVAPRRCPAIRSIIEETIMYDRITKSVSTAIFASALMLAGAGVASAQNAVQPVADSGIVRVKSAYSVAETVARLKSDVASKGIRFFMEIDQAKLAADAGIKLRPSTLLVFGNPPLGTLFIAANPLAGLDWPVRLLVLEDEKGDVWAAYTDFSTIAHRHAVAGADAEAFAKASGVIAAITSSVKAQ
jgi:uncharacterized protein (DUF302 family)